MYYSCCCQNLEELAKCWDPGPSGFIWMLHIILWASTYGGCSKGSCKEGSIGNTLASKGDPNQRGNLHSGHFWEKYFEQLPLPSLNPKPSTGTSILSNYHLLSQAPSRHRTEHETRRPRRSQSERVSLGLRFRVLGFRFHGLGFILQGLRFGPWGAQCFWWLKPENVPNARMLSAPHWGLSYPVKHTTHLVLNLGLRVQGLRVQGLQYMSQGLRGKWLTQRRSRSCP